MWLPLGEAFFCKVRPGPLAELSQDFWVKVGNIKKMGVEIASEQYQKLLFFPLCFYLNLCVHFKFCGDQITAKKASKRSLDCQQLGICIIF